VASVPGCTVFHDTTVVATWCYSGNQWWTFDDAWSLGQKTAWVKSKGLLGVMIWEMSGDTGTLMGAVDTGLH
jgi:chitinase